MWDEIFSVALSNGIFACLFVALLFYVLKDSRTREQKYQNTIKTLSSSLLCVKKIEEEVEEIKRIVVYKKGKKSDEKVEKI